MILISPDGYKSVKMVITATMIVINMKIKTKFFGASTGFFYENGQTSGTKSRKIVTNMGNEPSLQGLQTGR